MKTPRDARVLASLLLLIAFACAIPILIDAATPDWWTDHKLRRMEWSEPVPPLDYAGVNQGQLKNAAIAAYQHLSQDGAAVGGVGPITAPDPQVQNDKGSPGWQIRALISQWVKLDGNGQVKREILAISGEPTGVYSAAGTGKVELADGAHLHRDFQAITLGHLKAVANPFYERLGQLYQPGGFFKPWDGNANPPQDHSVVNLGQLKNVFSFNLLGDLDDDGLSDLEEIANGTDPREPTEGTPANYAYVTASFFGPSSSAAQLEWACDAAQGAAQGGVYHLELRTSALEPWTIVQTVSSWDSIGVIAEQPSFNKYRSKGIGLTSGKTYQFRVWYDMHGFPRLRNRSQTATISSSPDTDKDGLSDEEEADFGTDPNDPDSDNDGYTDGEEIAFGTNPLNINEHPDHNGNNDGGGGDPPNPDGNPAEIPIPVVGYITVDLGKLTGVRSSGGMAVGDDGAIAFYEQDSSTKSYKVARWQPIGTQHWSFKTGFVPSHGLDGGQLHVVGIDSSGTLYGNTLAFDDQGKRWIPCAFSAVPGWNNAEPVIGRLYDPSFLMVDVSICGQQEPQMECVILPSVVRGVSRSGGPWGTLRSIMRWPFTCDEFGYETKEKKYMWDQVFYGGTATPTLTDNYDSLDTDGNDRVDSVEIQELRLAYDPDPYLKKIQDVSHGGTKPYGQWFTVGGEFELSGPQEVETGRGFSAAEQGPAEIRVGRTNEAPRAVVEGVDLYTNTVKRAQEVMPTQYRNNIKIMGIIDNANGDLILAYAWAFIRPIDGSSSEPSWQNTIVAFNSDRLHILEMNIGGKSQGSPSGVIGDPESTRAWIPYDQITINTFIPMQCIRDPFGMLFSGDNRFGGNPSRATWNENGSFRTQQKYAILAHRKFDDNGFVDGAFGPNADGQGHDDRLVRIGETKKYDPDTSLVPGAATDTLSAAALADNNVQHPLLIGRAFAERTTLWTEQLEWVQDRDNEVKFLAKCNSTNPLHGVFGVDAPAISYTMYFDFYREEIGRRRLSIEGTHDGFPAYEVYVNGILVHSHDPLATGDGPMALFDPEEKDISFDGLTPGSL